jgi:hypothetical protein
VKFANWLLVAALFVIASGPALADTDKKNTREESSFGALKSPDVVEARKQADAWLKSVGKDDAATMAKVKALWAEDRPLLDKVSGTLALGDAEAAKLLAEARDESAPAPTAAPAILKDARKPLFFRANLAVAYGKALALRKVYEEALESLDLVKPEDVVDPSAQLFHKAVCEHALMLKDKADTSIDRLLVDALDAPERYRQVAALMHFDMQTWQDKDLGWIARKMDNIQRRLDLKRGGKNTQKQQKEVLVRLDEMIKELENKQKSNSSGQNGGSCPGGGDQQPGNSPGTDKSANPQPDTNGGNAKGTGQVDTKRVKEIAEVWGKLPEKERAQALRELTRSMPPRDRAVIEAYFKELQKKSSK